MQTQPLSETSPTQASPTKSTPTKGTVLKALPTVRDHTTDQLNEQGDEYIVREIDPDGEKKVAQNGTLQGGREYRCHTFLVPNRGDKLFMLATECARVLGYRDSYLLFNKNRSLHKIIANQAEKDDLIQQEILPYSYRSRQIAIVTARSMFRQFGSRLIVGGRRVRDDYWEAKARKQGFTEDDPAGEKRPGATKQREAAAAEHAHNATLLSSMPQSQIIYSNGEQTPGMAPIPIISFATTDDLRPRDYSNVQRPRHEISGQPYQDRNQATPASEILNRASDTTEFNKTLGTQRANRTDYLQGIWTKPHEPPAAPTSLEGVEGENVVASSQTFQSPSMTTGGSLPSGQPSMASHPQQTHPQGMMPQGYAPQTHPQGMIPHSPARAVHLQMSGVHRSPAVTMGPGGQLPQAGGYGYPQNQIWPPTQAQPAPMPQSHPGMPYGQAMPSPHMHTQQTPLHPQPQLHHQSSTGSLHGMTYPGMAGMNAPAYTNIPRNPYQPNPNPQHFMQSAATTQSGMPGWAPGPQQPGQWPAF